MTDLLYRWPEAARVAGAGRVIPKTKFYEHTKVSALLKAKFVEEVQRIAWTFKLSEDTLRLRPSKQVPEIQVFTIGLKHENLSPAILTAIDEAIPKPIIFELIRGDDTDHEVRMTAAYKPSGGPNPKPADYLSTGWIELSPERISLPTALDLPRLYAALISPLLPSPARDGESIEPVLVRSAEIRRLQRETSRLEKKMSTEPQFNRKVELRRELRAMSDELAALTDPNPPTRQD